MGKKITVIAILTMLMAISMTEVIPDDGNLPEPRPKISELVYPVDP